MADHVYDYTQYDDIEVRKVSGGWRLIDVWTGSEGLKIGIYIRGDEHSSYDGPKEYAFVNKGTDSESDWVNNAQQLYGSSTDMQESIEKAKYFVKHWKHEVTFIGHSKGGAEAAANAVATNKNAIIFNPATVNLEAYRLDSSNYSASMTAFIVKGDALNTLEGWFSEPIDKVVYLPQQYGGHWYEGWQTSNVDRINNHFMDAVIAALKEVGYW
ncbi:MAG: hypothetical protein M0Z31_13100 [Clostridia bacterium]|nr:hypothetical protein [Clostridia bacterium]